MLGNRFHEVLENQVLSDQDGLLVLDAPELCESAEPGQFVMIRGGLTQDPFLRRALSICDCRDGKLYLAYRVVGKATRFLRSLEAGEEVEVLGPLGQGFDLSVEGQKTLLIGGGIGMAPMVFLARALLERGKEVHIRTGGQSEDAVKGAEVLFQDLSCERSICTDDGSCGIHGLVTEGLPDLAEVDQVYACGPTPMLKALQKICLEADLPCQISLEGKMACGVGVCLGCTCKNPRDPLVYHKVCTHGPVFWAQEVTL